MKGVCTTSSLAPVDQCPYGDLGNVDPTIIQSKTNLTRRINCTEAFGLITSLGKSIDSYCKSDSSFSAYCCNSCKSNSKICFIIESKILFYLYL